MTKKLYFCLFFCVTTGTLLATSALAETSVELDGEPSSRSIRHARQATSLILSVKKEPEKDPKGPTATINGKKFPILNQQTGVVIDSSGTVLTVAHGLKVNSRLIVFAFDGKKWHPFSSEWVRYDQKADLAVIRLLTQGRSLTNVRVHSSSPEEGDEVFFWSYLRLGRIFRPFYRRAVVSAIGARPSPKNGPPRVIFFEAISVGGSSGSPLFNDAGNMVGIVSGQLERYLSVGAEKNLTRQPVGISYGIAIETIRGFLKAQGIPVP